jgi:hypothetical protein
MPFSEEPSPYKFVGGSGIVDGVAVEIVVWVEYVPTPLIFNAATWK